jgi:hypothetical protein
MPKHSLVKGSQKLPPKTTVTLAINSDALTIIRQEALAEGTSLNSRINTILEKYATFYKYMEMLESCIIPYNQFVKMLDLMDETALISIIDNDGNSHAISALKQNHLPITLDTIIEFIFKTGARYSGAYRSFHHYFDDAGCLCLVFDHKFGLKWSRVISAAFSGLIEKAVGIKAHTEILPYTVTIKISDQK